MSILYDHDREFFVNVYAGRPIDEACKAAHRLSSIIDKPVCFNFNGFHMSTSQGDVDDMVSNYHCKISRGKTQ